MSDIMGYYLYNIDEGKFIGTNTHGPGYIVLLEYNSKAIVKRYKSIGRANMYRISTHLGYSSLDDFYRSHVWVPVNSNDELDWLNAGWPELFKAALVSGI